MSPADEVYCGWRSFKADEVYCECPRRRGLLRVDVLKHRKKTKELWYVRDSINEYIKYSS